MITFRCYLIGGNDKIAQTLLFECDHDADAAIKAQQALAEHPDFASVEVWDGKRCVSKMGHATPRNV